MSPAYQFDLITPNGKPYSGQVTYVVVPGEKGNFGVLANHAALVSNCLSGKLRVVAETGQELLFSIGKGFFEVVKNKAILLTENASQISA
ncbi:MAG: hypothetical protein COV74_08480 [Candidatus Omnitrophica bacterium CG11_big_fil_rev_8_21_14_0_20_45_26]|uniref:ATP synthase F1 complex delta/epsilon subunit N-terminal domain-containing protein n=1 Tax=Candidatus Abzuiibacterium crystallinum TaxID=1974748 RepID=A0A2H0LM93_9BACT|nr:MAG: hypothetical protein COV74_08480 [Candidatus Omnitrophica bacterium CG11_big_fil_rev_8_21_14_0_20_45_26]PIW63697.1 MAG: hypothetical protein COW12_09365 [Candidatus Omnitrophica bacterium CG12_big_fil_rev_8_21_14_0_65_45_16]